MLIRIHLLLNPDPFFTRFQEDGRRYLKNDPGNGSPDNKGRSPSPSLIYSHVDEEEQDGVSSSYSNETIHSCCLGQKEDNDASRNCTDAVAYAWIERQISQQENAAPVNMNMTTDAADGDAGATADASDNQKEQKVSIEQKEDQSTIHQQLLGKDWLKGTLFYQDPGTPPSPPPKDYITVNFCFDDYDDSTSFCSQDQRARPSQSIYSVAFSSKIGSSLLSRRKSMAEKVKNTIKKRSSLFSHA